MVVTGYLDWKEGLMQMKGHAGEKQGSKITKECIFKKIFPKKYNMPEMISDMSNNICVWISTQRDVKMSTNGY